VVRCLSPGPGRPGGTVSAVRWHAWRPARRLAAGTRARLGGPVTSAAQGVQSRRCGGIIAFEFPIRLTGWLSTLGHSYGGNTVLFHAALDVRPGFACASGAACT